MSEKHIGKVVQVTGPVLDIRYNEGELPALLNAIEIDVNGRRLVAEVAQQVGDDVVRCIAMSSTDGGRDRYGQPHHRSGRGRMPGPRI